MIEKVLRYDGIPRRCDIRLRTAVESKIAEALALVETLGADPLRTDAVNHLDKARETVADYIDSQLIQIQG